jgi:hypothetical protein
MRHHNMQGHTFGPRAGLSGVFGPVGAPANQDPGSDLPRMLLPRTPLNKGKKKGPISERPGPQAMLAALGGGSTKR